MINAPKGPAGGFGITSLPKIGDFKAPEVGKAVEQLKTALEGLANNPIMKSLLGQSGFDGLGAQGKGQALGHAKQAAKAGEAAATPEEGLNKLVEGLKKFVEQLTEMLGGKKAPQAAAGEAGGAGGGEAAKGAEGAGGGEAAKGAEGAGAPEAAASAGAPQAAAGAEGAKDPLSMFLEFLTKLVEELAALAQKLQQMQQQQGTQAGGNPATDNTGIVPPGATTGPAAPAPAPAPTI